MTNLENLLTQNKKQPAANFALLQWLVADGIQQCFF